MGVSLGDSTKSMLPQLQSVALYHKLQTFTVNNSQAEPRHPKKTFHDILTRFTAQDVIYRLVLKTM